MSNDKKAAGNTAIATLFEGAGNTDEPAFVTAKCEDDICGVAYRIDKQKVGERMGNVLVIRLAIPMRAEREDEIVTVKKGEDVKKIIDHGLLPIAEATLREPTLVFIPHKVTGKHPTKAGMSLNKYPGKKFAPLRSAKNVDKQIAESCMGDHKAFLASLQGGPALLAQEIANTADVGDDGAASF
jgi:hypothetical protein